MSGIIRPIGKLSRLVDPRHKIFEGEYQVSIYQNVVEVAAYCWHCKSNVFLGYDLSPGEARQMQHDEAFRNNVVELAVQKLENDHQCGALIHDGKDVIDDVWREMNRRPA